MNDEEKSQLRELIPLAMDCMETAASIIDQKGTPLYYNRHSAEILDRKPEYIGTDIRSHHKNVASNEKVDQMLKDFKQGRTEPFHYEARPYGKAILVTLSPIIKSGDFLGCVQTVRLKESKNNSA